MAVAQNKQSLQLISGLEIVGEVRAEEVGFEPEIYRDDEAGFRCQRDINGDPLRPAFNVDFKDPSFLEAIENKEKK